MTKVAMHQNPVIVRACEPRLNPYSVGLPDTDSLVNATLNMRDENNAKISNVTRLVVIQAQNAQKYVFGWGSSPDPDGELTSLPQVP